MKPIAKAFSALIAAVALCTALTASAAAAAQHPSLSLNASLSSDGKMVILSLSAAASAPVSALQAELVYDSKTLIADGQPLLSSPWSGMLATTNIPAQGTALIAAASASAIENKGGLVATVRFAVSGDAQDTAYFYIRQSVAASPDGSSHAASNYYYITLDLKTGQCSAGGAVPSALLTPAELMADTVILQDGNYAAVAGGKLTHIDPDNKAVAPYINSDSRTMIPVSFVAGALGAGVSWNNAAREVTITQGENIIVLTIDSTVYTVNGQKKIMDTAPIIHTGLDRTMVPVHFIAEALGMSVTWDHTNRLVFVTPADRPWDLGGTTEGQSVILALYLLSPQMRDFT